MPKIKLPIQLREAILSNITADKASESLTLDLVFTTGAAVQRYSWENGEYYSEELVVTPEAMRLDRLDSGAAPVLDTHNQGGLGAVIGAVVPGTIKFDDGKASAQLRMDAGPENSATVRKIQNGIIRNVSVGYRIYQYEVIRKDGLVPIYRVTDWEPYEISFVPIGADAGAGIRSAQTLFPCDVINRSENNPTTIEKDGLMPKENEKVAKTAADDTATAAGANNDANTRQAATAVTTAVSTANDNTIREEGVKEERARVTEINRIALAANLPAEFARGLIDKGTALDEARKQVIDHMAKSQTAEGTNHVSMGAQDTEKMARAIESALLNKYDPKTFKIENGGEDFRSLTLIELGREYLQHQGIKTRGMSRAQVAGLLVGVERAGGHSTSDFPNILANVANKTLRQAYDTTPQTFKQVFREASSSDFKLKSVTQLSDAPALEKVNENGEFKRGAMSDGKEQYKLDTYGKIVNISRQVIINDDLGAFTKTPAQFARAAADLESDIAWGIITLNAALADNVTLFHASHANLAGSGAAITDVSIGASRAAMRTQKSLQSRVINIIPEFIIGPAVLEGVIRKYTTSENIVAAKAADFNPWRGLLTPIIEPRLDAASATAWYLASNYNQCDTIEYSYLEGQPGVYIETRLGFDVDGIEFKVRDDFAAKAIDYRGLYKNPGA